MRFLWCDHYDNEFSESFNRAGGAPRQDERTIQERAVFAFFSTGLSAIDTYCYALYAMGSMVTPDRFPVATKGDLKRINPFTTKDKFTAEFPTDRISACLSGVIGDKVFREWKNVRNDLIHCSAPGRIIQVSVGAPPSEDDAWRHIDFEIPINPNTTRARRNWLADTLLSLLSATDAFVANHL